MRTWRSVTGGSGAPGSGSPLFIAGLVLSGLTALPLERELSLLIAGGGSGHAHRLRWPDLGFLARARLPWCARRRASVFPFFFYGTDGSRSAHFAIAVALGSVARSGSQRVGCDFGLIACGSLVPVRPRRRSGAGHSALLAADRLRLRRDRVRFRSWSAAG